MERAEIGSGAGRGVYSRWNGGRVEKCETGRCLPGLNCSSNYDVNYNYDIVRQPNRIDGLQHIAKLPPHTDVSRAVSFSNTFISPLAII